MAEETVETELHPGTAQLLRWFEYEHLQREPLREVSQQVHALAWRLARTLPQGPELTAGLRKLLEAKDCFVRAELARGYQHGPAV